MAPHKHQELMTAAVERDGAAQQALLSGDVAAAHLAFAEAAELYRRSWDEAPPTAYGRLVGMLKSAVLAGDGAEEASYAREALADADSESVTAAYARALSALILADDAEAAAWARVMLGGGEAFARTADAIGAIAASDPTRYEAALTAIVRDFEARSEHLTGVAIADTALVLATLAARRGVVAAVQSPVLPGL
ncbi:MAG TPA: hypothetical protein VFH80_18265 [Solirubrobacteraceae bacterium]|nr:hypothetical protein [Solirubrobacteraceae bacterium]